MLWPNPAAGDEHRWHRFCLAAAFVVTLAWGAVYIGYGNRGIEDEPGQMEAIYHFAEHRPGYPEALPNLPGYHWLVVALTGGHPTIAKARLVTLGLALAGLAAFAGAWRRVHGSHPGGATLLLALLPVMQPFTAMVYTDVPAMTLLFAACWAHFAQRRALSAGLLLLACLVRQTSLIWAGYLVALETWNVLSPHPAAWRPALTQWLARCRWLLLLLLVAAAIVLYAGRLTVGTSHGNQLQPNVAVLHFGGVLLLLFGLPVWLASAGPAARAWRDSLRQHPLTTVAVTATAVVTAGGLALTYSNRHIWNRELFWLDAPSTFVLLRNWPLVWLEQAAALRWLSGFVVVGVAAGLIWLAAQQRCRRELLLVLPFGAVLLLTNGLVDPRYFIPPLGVALLFWEPPRALRPWQVRWFALLCAVQSPFLLDRLALW